MDQCWKNWAERMEQEILDKYMVKESKREAFTSRGAPLEWRRVRKNKKYRIRMWCDDCWARFFSLFKECKLQRLQSRLEESAEEEEMKQRKRIS